MIGNKIKSSIEDSNFTFTQIAEKLGITYQYLFKIFSKESVETSYLFKIANILNISVTDFFEDEPGGKTPVIDAEKLKSENLTLKRRVDELDEQLKDKRFMLQVYEKGMMKFFHSLLLRFAQIDENTYDVREIMELVDFDEDEIFLNMFWKTISIQTFKRLKNDGINNIAQLIDELSISNFSKSELKKILTEMD